MEIITYPIKPEKEKSWHYKSHPYFTKQAANVVSAYIEHFSKVGDTILDPYGGTGVTAIEALRLKRKVVIVDINPLACFLIRQNCKKIDTSKLQEAYLNLEKKVKDKIDSYYKTSNEELEKLEITYWYPKNIELPKNSDFQYVEDLYTPRQLHSYAFLYNEILQIEDNDIREMLKYIFSGTMSRANKTYNLSSTRQKDGKIKLGDGGSALFAQYRYWKPKTITELNIWQSFQTRFKDVIRGKNKWNELTKDIDIDKNLQVINGSALEISEYLPNNSIDYIYTDPPYGGNIAYLDLSTMWNAWLFPDMYKEGNGMSHLKEEEVIEGGDLAKTQEDYTNMFSKSFEEMGKVLKKEGWLSCVFAHKKLEFWNTIVESCEDNGMEFVGSTYQPTNNSSIHYKKNKANVLCSQRIASFKKTFNKSKRKKPDNLQKFILNEMEQAIVEGRGAGIDTLYQKVLDRLLETKSLSDAKRKGYLSLDKFLDDESLFVYESNSQLYYMRTTTDKHKELERKYLQNLSELKVYLKELLTKKRALTLDQIHKELFEIFSVDKKFPLEKDLPMLLEEIAYKSQKSGKWILKKSEKMEFDFDNFTSEKLVKIETHSHSHSEMIFRIVKIGEYLGFKSWIGKREQIADSFQGVKFSELSLHEFPLVVKTDSQKNKIQQVDVIWIDKLGFPRYAFEVEESTTILSGFERFMNLLDIEPDISNRLFIVAPKSRERKLVDSFKNSTYIGHPIYLENKVKFILKENLIKFYDEHIEKDFTEDDLKVLFNVINLN